MEPEEGEIQSRRRFTATTMEYEKVKVIGEGTFGQVFLARKGGARYALKRMSRESEGLSVTTIREIQILRAMSHPSVVRLIEVVADPGGDVHMVFPYFAYDLNRFIRSNRLGHSEVRHVFGQIASGVCYIHSRGVLHRDLKSANILLDQRLNVSIADFGMARYTAKTSMYTPGMVTLWYRAPEILLGSPTYSYGVDVWSLGCILAEMYLGRMIFQGNTEIAQLEMIIHACGSINEGSYPGVQSLPGFRTFRLPQSPRRIEGIIEKHDASAVELVSRMLCIDPQSRITISQVVESKYLAGEDRNASGASRGVHEHSIPGPSKRKNVE